VPPTDETTQLRNRVQVLEERIQGLRASRRILMNLIATQEREKRAKIQRLEEENNRLQKQSTRYAKAMFEQNIRIIRLEESVRRRTEGIS
jgi:DNA anti-recombination protein RmuC